MDQNSDLQQSVADEIQSLRSRLDGKDLPEDLSSKIEQMLRRLERMIQFSSYTEEFERTSHYIDWVVSMPWNMMSSDQLDIVKAREVFEQHHYGMAEVKERFLEYIAVLALNAKKDLSNQVMHAPVLLLYGLVGTGKTTFASSLAEALGRALVRIPFGGLSSARDLRGQSRLHLEAEPGQIMKAVRKSGVSNPVILLDEIDRVADETRGEIMGVLVELLDPEQNAAFRDNYLDHPFDLSKAIFLATCNNTEKIATAVLDRLEIITMPSYSDEEKIQIGKRYLLPKALKEAGLEPQHLEIQEELWNQVVRPLGYDAGIRTLQRTIKGMVRKAAKEMLESHAEKIVVDSTNAKHYLPAY
mgnify:CR=1 FL=1